jgi:hypothetical protein
VGENIPILGPQGAGAGHNGTGLRCEDLKYRMSPGFLEFLYLVISDASHLSYLSL